MWQQIIFKELLVFSDNSTVPAPKSVVVISPLPPIYDTSSRNMTYHIQLHNTVNEVPVFLNIHWIIPTYSSQRLLSLHRNAREREYYRDHIDLSGLSLSDSGVYICVVRMSSPQPFIRSSHASKGYVNLTIIGKSVLVKNSNKPQV